MAELIYIGGYGRSGSTLLEYLLTANSDVVACGEVTRHLRRFGMRKMCTCGHTIQACPVWSGFQHKSGRLKGVDHTQLTLELLAHMCGRYAVMVDSSKTAWGSTFMPFRLSKRLRNHFLLVHLVRDPRAVAWSTLRTKGTARKSSTYLRSLQTIVGWTIANLACEIFALFRSDCYLRLRYEDLVLAPTQVLGQIFARVSLDPPITLEPTAAMGNRHQLYGNSMRFQRVSPAEIKEDATWKKVMPKAHRRLVASLCWPFFLRYSYRLRVEPEVIPGTGSAVPL